MNLLVHDTHLKVTACKKLIATKMRIAHVYFLRSTQKQMFNVSSSWKLPESLELHIHSGLVSCMKK